MLCTTRYSDVSNFLDQNSQSSGVYPERRSWRHLTVKIDNLTNMWYKLWNVQDRICLYYSLIKSHIWAFNWYQNRRHWVTLNGPILSATKCSPGSLLSGNIQYTKDDTRYLCGSWASCYFI